MHNKGTDVHKECYECCECMLVSIMESCELSIYYWSAVKCLFATPYNLKQPAVIGLPMYCLPTADDQTMQETYRAIYFCV